MGKRRVGREALGPPGAEAADGSLKALVCDQLIEEGDASGRRVLQAHDAGPEGHQVRNRRRGVGGIDSGSTRPHDAFEPVELLQTQRAPRNCYREVERRATRLRHARLGLGSRSGKHTHGDTAQSGSVEPARTHALGEHQAIGTLHLEEAGKHRSIEGASLVEKLGPHVRREEEHRVPLLFKRPLRAKRGGCDARSHTGDEHNFAVGFFHIRSTFLRERRRTTRRLPCTIKVSRRARQRGTPRESAPQRRRTPAKKIAAGKLEACVALHHLSHRGAPCGAAGFKVGAVHAGDETRVHCPSHCLARIVAHLVRTVLRVHGRAIA